MILFSFVLQMSTPWKFVQSQIGRNTDAPAKVCLQAIYAYLATCCTQVRACQKPIALASAEAELCASVSACCNGSKHMQACIQFLREDGIKVEFTLILDNSAAKAFFFRSSIGRNRHISVRLQWLQRELKLGMALPSTVCTRDNTADFATKILRKDLRHVKFSYFFSRNAKAIHLIRSHKHQPREFPVPLFFTIEVPRPCSQKMAGSCQNQCRRTLLTGAAQKNDDGNGRGLRLLSAGRVTVRALRLSSFCALLFALFPGRPPVQIIQATEPKQSQGETLPALNSWQKVQQDFMPENSEITCINVPLGNANHYSL